MIPRPLTHSSATVLEFEAFRELLRGYAQSELYDLKPGPTS